ncbi:MAG: hypothetical protein ACK4VY_03235 [Brevundimonas sp.]
MLTFLAAMRGTSLYPCGPQEPVGDLAVSAAESARIESKFRVPDAARLKNEKVLVFVEETLPCKTVSRRWFRHATDALWRAYSPAMKTLTELWWGRAMLGLTGSI